MDAKQPIILKDLLIGYRTPVNGSHAVYGPLNVEINQAEMIGLIGRNGIGKSTLLRTIAGLQPQLKGEIMIMGKSNSHSTIKEMARMISFVSTEPVVGFQIRVDELIAMGRFPYTGWLGKLSVTDMHAVHAAVEQTGVSHLLNKSMHELSDGERQKVMIARALAQDTPLIILDEPTAFLDLPARYEILRILNDLTLKSKKTILFSTHDLAIAMDVADKLWLLADNELFQGAPEDLLINKVFRKLFLNSPAEFDYKTSVFRFKRELNPKVEILGEKKYRVLTKKAMERIGLTTTEGIAELIIDIHENEGMPVWHLKNSKSDTSFHSIFALVTYIKNSK